ncbi:unnamed protein product [Caenorhabditis auriculariae]|uniref:Uncharacterized protein n=1 Tax=Caenorhabditis auriculariae TaxID=2777116 RepID=A0A8S1GQQ4_9PELO|nr:unnamed protein product [Caenorhabditis auriculariae]
MNVSNESSRPIAEVIGVLHLNSEDSVPTVLYEFPSQYVTDPVPVQSISKFARPRGWFNVVDPPPSEYFYQMLTTELGERRFAYIFISWECSSNAEHNGPLSSSTSAVAVSFVAVSKCFCPEAFRALLVEMSMMMRVEDLPNKLSAEELISTILFQRVQYGRWKTVDLNRLRLTFPGESFPQLNYTGTDVAKLFSHLGMQNVTTIVHAVLSDARVVISSSSMMRLSEAQNAICSLIYPFSYLHSCVTVLPESLAELLESPTPYLIGVLTELVAEKQEDYVLVLLDRGEKDFFCRLQLVLFPDAETDDVALRSRRPTESKPKQTLDKELRACFLIYFCEILFGYQYFILYSRKHGLRSFTKGRSPLITFHAAAFCGFRGIDCEFTTHILTSAYFQVFCSIRAIPYRQIDIFDKICCWEELDKCIRTSHAWDTVTQLGMITEIADYFLKMERFLQVDALPQSECLKKIRRINVILATQSWENFNVKTEEQIVNDGEEVFVPVPEIEVHHQYHRNSESIHRHRLEALRTFIKNLFAGEINAALKRMAAVELSMRFAPVRAEFCRHLARNLSKAIMGSDQFDIITRLVNCTLEHEDRRDVNGVVFKLLHLSTIFCRKLPRGTYQYVYTVIQHHKGQSLWALATRPCAMEIAAEEARPQSPSLSEDVYQQENDIIQAQAKHYINLMICVMVPMDVLKSQALFPTDEENNTSGLENDIAVETLQNITKEIGVFLDRILAVSGRPNSILSSEIQKYVDAHAETLQDVYNDSAALSTTAKITIPGPHLLAPHEFLINNPISCFLLASGHDLPVFHTGEVVNPTYCILPAYGDLYITNYRLIFKGKPLNLDVSNEILMYSLPVYAVDTVKRESAKKSSVNGLKDADNVHAVVIVFSRTFQSMKLAFSLNVRSFEVDKLLDVLKNEKVKPFGYNTVRHIIENTSTLTNHHKYGSLGGSRRPEILKKKDVWKIRDIAGGRGSYSVNNDLNDIDHNATHGTAVHQKYAAVDYERLGFLSGNPNLRLSYANSNYKICPTYPACFVIPAECCDTSLTKVAKGFVEERLPVVTWTSADGSLLIRGSSFSARDVVKKLKKAVTSHRATNTLRAAVDFGGSQQTIESKNSDDNSSSSVMTGADIRSSETQIHYFSRLSASSPKNIPDRIFSTGLKFDSANFPEELVITKFDKNDEHSENSQEAINGDPAFADFTTVQRNFAIRSSAFFGKRDFSVNRNAVDGAQKSFQKQRKSLYILVEKGYAPKIRLEGSIEVVTIKHPKESTLKRSFSRLLEFMKNEPSESDQEISAFSFSNWQNTGWPLILSNAISLANSIVSLMSLNKSSVAICLEQGRNSTAIFCSLVQLLSDAFYRSFAGFQVLIEKEWLAFGHTFGNSSEHYNPAFLVFLDCVHQIHTQFPGAFEFSQFYIRFVAYHSNSGFFRTFLEENESKRMKMEVIAPESNSRKESSVFDNTLFAEGQHFFLFPSSSLSQIAIWKYFEEENFHHGTQYDLECVKMEIVGSNLQSWGTDKTSETVDLTKRCCDLDPLTSSEDKITETNLDPGKYKNKPFVHRNAEKHLLSESVPLEHLQRRSAMELFRASNDNEFDSATDDALKLKQHKLVNFVPGLIPAKCGRCGLMITKWSRAIQCRKCRFHVHRDCVRDEFISFGVSHKLDSSSEGAEEVPVPNEAIAEMRPSTSFLIENENSRNNTLNLAEERVASTLQVPVPPLCTGYLSKRGAKLKLWVPRYFVLYSNVPKIWYYDDFDQWRRNSKPCGCIDLSEFTGMDIDEVHRRPIFELKTKLRSYKLMTDSFNDIIRWKDCIEQVVKE